MIGDEGKPADLKEQVARLEEQLHERDRTIARLEEELAAVRAELAELRELLGRNSRNSSQPPSADPAAVREVRRPAKRSKRKRGAQKGHKGHHRALVPAERVDEVVVLRPDRCACCGEDLPTAGDAEPDRHQVVEVPEIRGHVTEYEIARVRCPSCGKVNRRALPEGVSWSPFGPRLVGLVGLLTGAYRMSKRRAAGLLADVLGIRISLGALSQCEHRLSQALEQPVEQAAEYVLEQPVKYCDATSWRQAKRPLQLWTVACVLVTVFRITADGTKETLRGVLSRIRGVLVSDRAVVFNLWPLNQRQACWAHLIRAFVAFSERTAGSQAIGEGLLELAQRLFAGWRRIRDGTLDRAGFALLVKPLKKQVKALLERGTRCGHRKTEGTCRKLLEHFEAMWTFVSVEGVDPTNNHSERELRHLVIWRKTSFATQSDRGDRYVERVMTAVATLRKQKRNILEYLATAYSNALKRQPAPSLLPEAVSAT
jgi:transposase